MEGVPCVGVRVLVVVKMKRTAMLVISSYVLLSHAAFAVTWDVNG